MINLKEHNNKEIFNDNVMEDIKKQKKDKKKRNKKTLIIFSIITILLIILEVILIIQFFGDPVVLLKGSKEEVVEYGSIYKDKGIKAYTKLKNVKDLVITENNIDTSKIGNYYVKYKVPYNNSYKVYTRNVSVIDTKSPEIKLIGNYECEIEHGANFNELGYTAIDEYDGDISDKVVIDKVEIDENNFENHYKVKDSSGNFSETVRHIKIVDTQKPVLTLNGNSVICVPTGNNYIEQGAIAIDNKDGDISKNIQISNNIDVSKEGTYKVTYSVKDVSGNFATVDRTVIVSNTEYTGIIFLTFDDGPSISTTPKILDILKQKGVNATFFILNYGNDTEYLVKRAVDEGNAIGIHGYSHKYSEIYASIENCYNNIIKLQEKIYHTTGENIKIVRFPGGSSNTVSKKYCQGIMTDISKKILDEGFKYYDWNVLSGDSGNVKTKEGVYNNVINGLKPGRNNIVLMHDFSQNNKTVEALPEIIDYGLANGYKFEIITTETEMVTQKIQN